MEYKHFQNIFQMFEYLDSEVDRLDINQSLNLPEYYFVDKEGEVYACGDMAEFCRSFNKRFSTKLSDTHSYGFAYQYVLFFNEEESSEEVVEVTPLISIVADEAPADGLTDDVIGEALVVDWDYVSSIENSAEGKLELDKYAEDFGVKLKRNKTLTNMIIDFKKEMEA